MYAPTLLAAHTHGCTDHRSYLTEKNADTLAKMSFFRCLANYIMLRRGVEVPQELYKKMGPFSDIEKTREELMQRNLRAKRSSEKDESAEMFASLLIEMRDVILRGAAIVTKLPEYADHPIFLHPVFQDPAFKALQEAMGSHMATCLARPSGDGNQGLNTRLARLEAEMRNHNRRMEARNQRMEGMQEEILAHLQQQACRHNAESRAGEMEAHHLQLAAAASAIQRDAAAHHVHHLQSAASFAAARQAATRAAPSVQARQVTGEKRPAPQGDTPEDHQGTARFSTEVKSVRELWMEWTEGWPQGVGTPIRDIMAKDPKRRRSEHGAFCQWKATTGNSFCFDRLKVLRHIEDSITEPRGKDLQDVLEQLEQLRDNGPIRRLSERLPKLHEVAER